MDKVNPIQVQKHLKGMEYPASKEDIVKQAKDGGADKELCEFLDRLPDEQYDTPADVSKAIGQLNH